MNTPPPRAGTHEEAPSFADRFHNETTAWVVLGVSLCITVFSWWLSREYVTERARERFAFEVQKARQAIVKRMQEYEQVLRGGVGLFVSSTEVSRLDWRNYVENLRIDTYWPGIQGMGYAVMVPARDLSAHLARVRAEGFGDYTVHPEGPRDPYSSILYLEPFSGRNLRAFGYDMYSDPTRRAAMIQARDSGRPAVSARVTLVQETSRDVQPGFLMYLPLYRPGMPLATPEQRRAAHYGYVYSPFRVLDLMHGILGADSPYLDFFLYDGTDQEADALLHASADPGQPRDETPRFVAVERIDLPGRVWTARFVGSAALEEEMANPQPLIIGAAGLAVDLLLFAVIWSLSQSHARANRAAREMARLLEQSRLSASVFHNAREGILITDAAANILEVNEMFTELTGYGREEVLGRNPRLLASGRHDKAFYARLWQDLLATGHWSGEIWNRRKDGAEYAEVVNISAVRDAAGRTTHYVGLFSDITEQKNHQSQLEFMAQHDVLTGLPNRALLMDRLEVALAQARRSAHRVAVAYLDLDGFKPLNDTHGHEAGDLALREVAQRLKSCIRSGDTVARLGGDEFVLILLEQAPGDFLNPLERACHALSQPYYILGGEMRMSASIGYTVNPDDPAAPEELLRHADMAMYHAKQAGRNRCQRYQPEDFFGL